MWCGSTMRLHSIVVDRCFFERLCTDAPRRRLLVRRSFDSAGWARSWGEDPKAPADAPIPGSGEQGKSQYLRLLECHHIILLPVFINQRIIRMLITKVYKLILCHGPSKPVHPACGLCRHPDIVWRTSQLTISIRGHRSFIPSTLPPEHACLVPPGRDAASSPWWRQPCARATATGGFTAFFWRGCFHLPCFQSIDQRRFHWPAAHTAAPCSLRLLRHHHFGLLSPWLRGRSGQLKDGTATVLDSYCQLVFLLRTMMARLLLKQPLQLGWPPKCGQHGGASFTHRYRPMRFLDILKSHWYRGDACNSVTVIWAGNDLGRCAADDL